MKRYINLYLISVISTKQLPLHEKIRFFALQYWIFIAHILDAIIGILSLGFICSEFGVVSLKYYLDNTFYIFKEYGFKS